MSINSPSLLDGDSAGKSTNLGITLWGDWERRERIKKHDGSYDNWEILRKPLEVYPKIAIIAVDIDALNLLLQSRDSLRID